MISSFTTSDSLDMHYLRALAIVIVGLRLACFSASARSLHLVREHNHVCAVGLYNICASYQCQQRDAFLIYII